MQPILGTICKTGVPVLCFFITFIFAFLYLRILSCIPPHYPLAEGS